MFIQYRTNSTITAANLMADLHAMITGGITTVNDFSSGCDKTNSLVAGAYPAEVYESVQANAGTGVYTYRKTHNEYADVDHYFRLTFDVNTPKLDTLSLSQDWNSGSNAMVNSQSATKEFIVHGITVNSIYETLLTVGSFDNPSSGSWGTNNGRSTGLATGDRITPSYITPSLTMPVRQTRLTSQLSGTAGSTGEYYVNIPQLTGSIGHPCTVLRETTQFNAAPVAYNQRFQRQGIDAVITDKFFYMRWTAGGINHGVFDLGKNGVTNQFSDSMLMGMIDLRAGFARIPRYYKFSTQSYGTLADVDLVSDVPARMPSSNQSISVVENPVQLRIRENGNPTMAVYGLSRVPEVLVPGTRYTGPSSVQRFIPISSYSLTTE